MFIGIDPGLYGAIAALSDCGDLTVWDMPIHNLARSGKAKNEIDHVELARIMDCLTKSGVRLAMVEKVWSRKDEGPSSAFAFGRAFGIALGIAAAQFWRVELVSPQRWKKAMGTTSDKDSSRHRASELLPRHAGNWHRVKDDGRAEAALLAEYARRIYQGENQKAVENGFDAGTKIAG